MHAANSSSIPTARAPFRAAEIVALFRGEIPPARVGLTYRIALAVTALAMVLLPLVYLGLAVAAAGTVVWWTQFGLVVFQSSVSIWTLLIYLTPIAAGGIVVFFLFKPFFAPRAASPKLVTVDLDAEPALRAFLEEICRRVGVGLPAAVHLDSACNASASFRRGWLSLGRRDLVLTLGAPFIRTLTAQQLGGVIAHEFGHFAQRGGMLSHYVIASINGWFGAVVFGRDRWDQWLVRQSHEADFRVGLALWCARGGVWLSRKVLHGLMYAAHALSCWLSRQMEFDADYYAGRFQGAESFAATARQTALAAAAEAQAGVDLNTWWTDRQIVPDFAEHVAFRLRRLEPSTHEAIDHSLATEETAWHSTHPSMRERIARVRAEAPEPIFTTDAPATLLFADFENLSRRVTEELYRHSVGDEFAQARVLAAESIEERAAREDASAAALQRLTGGAVGVDRPALLTLAELAATSAEPTLDAAELATWFTTEAARLSQALVEDSAAFERQLQLGGVRRFVAAGIKVNAASFQLKSATLETVNAEFERTVSVRLKHDALLLESARRTRERLRAFGRAAHARPGLPESARLLSVLEAFAQLSPCFTLLPRLLVLQSHLQLFEVNHTDLRENKSFQLAHGALREEARQALATCLAAAESVSDPFAEPGTTPLPSVVQCLRAGGKTTDFAHELAECLSHLIRLYFRLLREAAFVGEAVERAPPSPG